MKDQLGTNDSANGWGIPLCDSPFWDGEMTLNSTWPRFTACFLQTAVVGAPCLGLWLLAVFHVLGLVRMPDSLAMATRPSLGKKTCSLLLALLSLSELTTVALTHGWPNDLAILSDVTLRTEAFSPAVLLLTLGLVSMVSQLEERKSVGSSMLLSCFWLTLTLAQVIPVYTLWLDQVYVTQPVECGLACLKAGLIALLAYHTGRGQGLPHVPEGERIPCPDPYESVLSRMTFSWMKSAVLAKGSRMDLKQKDIFHLLPPEKSTAVVKSFNHHWTKEVDSVKLRNQANTESKEAEDPEALLDRLLKQEKSRRKGSRTPALKRTKSVEHEPRRIPFLRSRSEMYPAAELDSMLPLPVAEPMPEADKDKDAEKDRESSKKAKAKSKAQPSFMKALFMSNFLDFTMLQSIKLLSCTLDMSEPVLFGMLLHFLQDDSAPVWQGYGICAGMVFSKLFRTLLRVRQNFWNHTLAIQIHSSVCNTIFSKVLSMDTESRQESTVGQAVNLISVDAGDVCHAFLWMAPEMVVVPFRIVITLFMLYHLLGPSMLISVFMLAIMVPINSYVARKQSTSHKKLMDLKDARLKSLTEVINGVKILKLYAWEPSFIDKVNAARDKELDVMKWQAFWDTVMHFYWCVTPYIVAVTIFVTYVYSSEDHYLSPGTAFVALSLIDILRGSMGTVPHIISHFIKVMVSFGRLNEFMGRTDLDDDIQGDAGDGEDVVSIKSGFFSWSSEAAPTLKNINMSVKKGSLVAVVGTVGCGKSSLLSACLGEMKKLKGHVSVKGSVAYVPQQAWIQHATLKDNVLFGQELDSQLYNQCLDNCALRTDLQTLPGGDMTEIGEKGINISGGQKQRVSLARAVYSQADVYLLDDPLSAVDCHVGAQIFNEVIGHNGMLAGKTRVLVTHGVQWLPHVDQIVVLRHGRVSEVGSYHQLLSHNGPFASFLRHYLRHSTESAGDPQVERVKLEILQRLESIPKELKPAGNSTNNADSGHGSLEASSDSSSSSDNEAVIQELLRSASQEEARRQEQGDQQNEEDEKERLEEIKEQEKKKAHTSGGQLVEEEEDEMKSASLGTFKDFSKGLGYHWVALMLALFAAQQMAERFGDIALGRWTDDPDLNNLTVLPPDSEQRVDLNNYYLTLFAGFGVMHALSTMAFKVIMLLRKVVTARKLHSAMLSRVLRAPMSFFDTTPVGRIVNRFSSDLNTVDTNLVHTMEWALYCFLGLVGKVLIVCYITPAFAFVLLPSIAVFLYVRHYYVPTMRQLESLSSKAKAPLYSFFSETLNGAAVVRAFRAQGRFTTEYQRRFDMFTAVHFVWGNCHKWVNLRMEAMSAMVMGAVVLSAIYLRHSMSAGMVGLAVSAAIDMTGTFQDLIHMLSWLQTQLVSVDHVKEYSEMKVEADWRKEETAPGPKWPEAGEIQVNDLKLRYREGLDLVLNGVDVRIKAGERVGIVGRTGAGKSSLTLALFRLVEPAGGEVKVDGVVTSDLGLHDLRSRLTILPQDPVIFAGTLRMNLDPFGLHKDEAVQEALRHAHLQDFVSGLKDGLDHECGEGGENLSMGQRQLLCLARTLLHRSRVLVLDEATAAVDLETDDLIQRTLRTQFSGCTVLTIAHRLNTVMDYDKILVLDKGKVKEFDSPTNLMDDPTTTFHDMAKKAGLLKRTE